MFSVCRLVSRRCHNISTMLRFHPPLIKPDVRVSRIRLSDKDHAFAHEKLRVRSESLSNPSV